MRRQYAQTFCFVLAILAYREPPLRQLWSLFRWPAADGSRRHRRAAARRHFAAAAQLIDIPIADFSDHLVVPGFVDTHVHFPQVDVIASYGTQLLEWLQQYTFPEEQKFHQHEHAAQSARFFFDQLLGNGTTTASVFTVHPQSVDAFFTEAQKRKLEMIAGKCLINSNAPAGLRDTADSGYHDSKALIERWHKQGRLHYSITQQYRLRLLSSCSRRVSWAANIPMSTSKVTSLRTAPK